MAIKNTSLTSSPQSLLDPVPAGASYALTVLLACNTAVPDPSDEDLNSDTLSVFVVPDGDSLGSNHLIVNRVQVRAGETFTLDTEKLILEEGDQILASTGTGTDLAVTISYVEI